MTRLLAYMALMAASLVVMLGNYWFTFGLWPKSWLAFFGFGFIAVLLRLIYERVEKETK